MSINPAHIHLALNHVPVLGVLFGTILLAMGLWRRNDTIRRTSLVVLLLTGAAAGAVYLTGEPAEELIENAAGVSEKRIERHEDAAAVATSGAALLGVAALVLLWRARRSTTIVRSIPRPKSARTAAYFRISATSAHRRTGDFPTTTPCR